MGGGEEEEGQGRGAGESKGTGEQGSREPRAGQRSQEATGYPGDSAPLAVPSAPDRRSWARQRWNALQRPARVRNHPWANIWDPWGPWDPVPLPPQPKPSALQDCLCLLLALVE